ncbi:hypothetical protein GmHk_10G028901 [Glycine max]|nr:hypothetical protein GmHk_10G028901 [Glycine max]KAH1229052.1 hypothetical protein GmHk_10G028901 [Glycine max]
MNQILSDPQRPLVGGCVEKSTGHPKAKHCPHVLSRRGYEYLEQKLMAEKTKKKLEEAAQFGSIEGVIDPLSLIRRHMKWKMARIKKTGQMMSEAAKEIAEKIRIVWRSRHHRVRLSPMDPCACCWNRCHHKAILWIGSMKLPKFILHGSRRTRAVDSTNQGPTGGVDHRKSDSVADVILQPDAVPIQSQGLALPPEPEVGPLVARVSTKGSCVDPSPTDPDTGDFNKCGLHIEENPSRLVALGRVYEGSTTVHNIPLLHGHGKLVLRRLKIQRLPFLYPLTRLF